MAENDLEVEYNNRARVPDHAVHMAAWRRDAAAYRDSARCELEVAYGSGPRHRVDFFHPDGEADGPVVLFLHGGYWQALDKSSASHLARGANQRGLSVAVPSYDLAPAATLAEIVACVGRAADFVADRVQRPLLVAGHSAGGHLAACLMARPAGPHRSIRACMPISGLFDLVPLVATSVNGALHLTVEEALRLSPLHWAAPHSGQLDAFVGGAESSEYHRQTRTIVEKWRAAGVETRLHTVPGAHHFDVIAGLANPADPLVETLVTLSSNA